jgi:hypothetical protein
MQGSNFLVTQGSNFMSETESKTTSANSKIMMANSNVEFQLVLMHLYSSIQVAIQNSFGSQEECDYSFKIGRLPDLLVDLVELKPWPF